MKKLIIAAALAFSVAQYAQITTPQPSPMGEVEQTVGVSEIEVEYSRPSMKGRSIFGSLIPYNEIWRTGANASTKIEFSSDVKIAGQDLKAGTYALYTIPGTEEWTIIFNTNLELWGTDGYQETEDALRVKVNASKISEAKETFTIEFDKLNDNGCEISLVWENTKVAIPVTVNTEAAVLADIEKVMAGPAASDYYRAAVYYLSLEKELDQALTWINTYIEKSGKEQFWVLHNKALILGKLGKYQEAIVVAERSKALAEKANYAAYITKNEVMIKEWKAKK